MIRNEFPVRATHRESLIVAGSFAGNGASSPTAASREGVGFTVSRVSAGVYRIQLGSQPSVPAGLLPATDKNLTLIAGLATISNTTAATDRTVTILASGPTTGIFDFEVKVGAAATDMTANERLNFLLVLTDSVAVPTRG